MIKIFVGGVGQGKTVTAVKEILHRKETCFSNFNVKCPYMTRLKKEHIISYEEQEGKKKPKMCVNWKFWKDETEKGGFDVYIDEAHNIMNSRRAMSSGPLSSGQRPSMAGRMARTFVSTTMQLS